MKSNKVLVTIGHPYCFPFLWAEKRVMCIAQVRSSSPLWAFGHGTGARCSLCHWLPSLACCLDSGSQPVPHPALWPHYWKVDGPVGNWVCRSWEAIFFFFWRAAHSCNSQQWGEKCKFLDILRSCGFTQSSLNNKDNLIEDCENS